MKLMILVLSFLLCGCVYMFEGDPSPSCDEVKARVVAEGTNGEGERSSDTACTFQQKLMPPKV